MFVIQNKNEDWQAKTEIQLKQFETGIEMITQVRFWRSSISYKAFQSGKFES